MHSAKLGTSGFRIPKNCHGLLNLVVFILVIKTSNKAVTLNEILWMETVTLPEDVCCWRLWSTRSTSRWAGSVAGRQLQQVVRRRRLLSLSTRTFPAPPPPFGHRMHSHTCITWRHNFPFRLAKHPEYFLLLLLPHVSHTPTLPPN